MNAVKENPSPKAPSLRVTVLRRIIADARRAAAEYIERFKAGRGAE